MITAEKACTRCRLTKPAGDFHKDRKGRDGRSTRCKECVRKYQAVNKDTIREQRRQYLKDNRETVLESKRQYYYANREAAQECHSRWRVENTDAVKAYAVRVYRLGGRPADKPWPDHPIAYTTAHCRVKATYGAASNHPCAAMCGKQAYAWSYDHSDPNPLFHKGSGPWADCPPIPYSPDPERYDPLCRGCHIKRDRYGAT